MTQAGSPLFHGFLNPSDVYDLCRARIPWIFTRKFGQTGNAADSQTPCKGHDLVASQQRSD